MHRLVALASWVFVVAIAGCNDGGPPPTSPAPIAADPVTTVVVDGGPMTSATTAVAAEDPPANPASSGDGGADFASCSVDSDCVAVARVGCCKNGWKEAVNKQSVGAYNASFVCEKKRRICPQYRIVDRREAVCASDPHKCQMVAPAQITCSGSGPSAHACPSGTQCDGTGHCAGAGAAPTP